jgi:serine/threonine-protein kinase
MLQLSVEALLDLLSRYQLLDAQRLGELERCAPRLAEARELAHELVHRGWLTTFQVNQIFLDRVNDLVVGQFVLLDRLEEGGMGQVFKAWQRNLQRIVALKLIRKEGLENPRLIQRFQREIRAAGQLAHPHIVHAYDAGQENGGYFIAMEYIEGVDLARMVQQSGPLEVPQACDFLRQAALGLQHAYEHGLVHRDIKPANLLWTSGKGPGSGSLRRPVMQGSGLQPRPGSGLNPRPGSGLNPRPGSGLNRRPSSGLLARPGTFPWGIIKILDLGLARWIDPEEGTEAGHLTQIGSFMGTPDFMAPEQALNPHACDIRSDVYSLGCTFYYLLSGQVPFPGGSITEKVIRHQKEEPEPVEQVRHCNLTSALGRTGTSPLDPTRVDLPVSVACLVRRLMAKSPAERVQTPGELAELLEEIQNDAGQVGMMGSAVRRIKGVQQALAAKAAVADVSTPRSRAESCATVATLDEPLAWAPPEILLQQGGPAPRRWLPLLLVALAVATGMFAAVVRGRGGRPLADTSVPPPSPEETQWRDLQTCFRDKKSHPDELRLELVGFRARYPTSPHARDVARLIMQIPSPLDRLEWKQSWPQDNVGPRPPELKAVLGPGSGPVMTLAFSPDGHFLVAGGDKQVRYWNIACLGPDSEKGPIHFKAHEFQMTRIAFAPEGRHFASASFDGTCKLWDTKEPACVLALKQQDEAVTALAFSPDGKTLATAGHDGTVRLWNRNSGELRLAMAGKVGAILSLAFSPDGRWLFWGGNNHQVRWADAATGKTRDKQAFTKAAAWINVLAFHPGGGQLVLGGGGEGGLYLCRWDGKQLTSLRRLKHHRAAVRDLTFSPDGNRFVSVSEDKSVALCDGNTGELLKSWDMHFSMHAVAFAPDGRHFAAGNAPPNQNRGSVFLFRAPTSPRLASR